MICFKREASGHDRQSRGFGPILLGKQELF